MKILFVLFLALVPSFHAQFTTIKTFSKEQNEKTEKTLRVLEGPQKMFKKWQTKYLESKDEIKLLQDDDDEWEDDYNHYESQDCMDYMFDPSQTSTNCNWREPLTFCTAYDNDPCTFQDIETEFVSQCNVPLYQDIFDEHYHLMAQYCRDDVCFNNLIAPFDPMDEYADLIAIQDGYCNLCGDGSHNGECSLLFFPYDFECLIRDNGVCSALVDVFDEEDQEFMEAATNFVESICLTGCDDGMETMLQNYADNCDHVDKILDHLPEEIRNEFVPEVPEDIDPSALGDIVGSAFDTFCSQEGGEWCVVQFLSIVEYIENNEDDIPNAVNEWLTDICVPNGCMDTFADSWDDMTTHFFSFGGLDSPADWHLHDGVVCVKTRSNKFCAVEIMEFIWDEIEQADQQEEFDLKTFPARIDTLLDEICPNCIDGYLRSFNGMMDHMSEVADVDVVISLQASLMCQTTSNDATSPRNFCTTAAFEYLMKEENLDDLEHCTEDEEDGMLIADCRDDAECQRVMQEMQVVMGKDCVEWLSNSVFGSMEMFGDFFEEILEQVEDELPDEIDMEEVMDPVNEFKDMIVQSAEMIVNCPTIFLDTDDGEWWEESFTADSAATHVHAQGIITFLGAVLVCSFLG